MTRYFKERQPFIIFTSRKFCLYIENLKVVSLQQTSLTNSHLIEGFNEKFNIWKEYKMRHKLVAIRVERHLMC
jgi:hypothetical protein